MVEVGTLLLVPRSLYKYQSCCKNVNLINLLSRAERLRAICKMFRKIGMVILLVSDVHKLITFYRDALGMKVRHESDEWVELCTYEGSTSLALHLSQKVVKKI